jgi:uncharacterized membrane protein YuzA (DUF378 family)
MRIEADSQMSVAWLIVPFIPIIGIVLFIVSIFFAASISIRSFNSTGTPSTSSAPFFAFFGLLILFYIILIVAGVIYLIMIYKLAKRRNTHFQRQLLLYEDLLNMAKEVSTKRGVDVSMHLNNMDRILREAKVEETEKSAALWTILSFLTGIATLYIFYYLMKDFFKHERREDQFFEDLNRGLTAAGVPVNLPRRTLPVPDRSFVLYFILSIITVGIFGIYWIYVLLTDPNNHFRQQWMIEDTIIAQVSPVLGGPSMPPPSSPPPPPTSGFTLPPSSP